MNTTARNIEPHSVTPVHQDDTSTDVFLRSTDNVNFRVPKEILSNSSSFFQTMFSIPQQQAKSYDQELKNGVPVIDVKAEGSLLRNLLLFCNPAPELVRLEELQIVAIKYEMYDVAKRVLKERVRASIHLIPPIMLAAVEMNAETSQNADAHLGAVAMLLFPEELDDILDLELIKTIQAHSLVAYRKECVAAAVKVARPAHNHYQWMSDYWTTVNWFKDGWGEHGRGNCNEGGNCFIGRTSGKIMMRFWWREYIYAAKAELEKWPCGSSVQRGEIFDKAVKDGSQCVKCAPGLEGQLRKFAALFASEVDKAVSSVQLVL